MTTPGGAQGACPGNFLRFCQLPYSLIGLRTSAPIDLPTYDRAATLFTAMLSRWPAPPWCFVLRSRPSRAAELTPHDRRGQAVGRRRRHLPAHPQPGDPLRRDRLRGRRRPVGHHQRAQHPRPARQRKHGNPGRRGRQRQRASASARPRWPALDREHDLAHLRLSGAPLPALALGDSATAPEGQRLAFTGFPLGMVLGLHHATHRAMLSAITPVVMPSLELAQPEPARASPSCRRRRSRFSSSTAPPIRATAAARCTIRTPASCTASSTWCWSRD